MIQIDETKITQLILHRVVAEEGKSIFNDATIKYSYEDDSKVLKKIFLTPFAAQARTFEFTHDIDLDYNILYNLSTSIYEGGDFIEQSQGIAQLLISSSKHPNIKDGDLFVAKLDDIKFNGKYYEGIAIYKFEDKDSFIETTIHNKRVSFQLRKGIGTKKPDKACLIIFSKKPYTILVIDNASGETDYWQNEFINHKPKDDNVNQTHNFLTLTKNFITSQIPENFEIGKAEQIDLLNRSVEYFKSNENFEKKNFEKEVLQHSEYIKSFRDFDQVYQEENNISMADNFTISPEVVKKQAKIFKSVLKLDKNFHVYIHGNADLIEKGVEKDGRKFYKIYYDDES